MMLRPLGPVISRAATCSVRLKQFNRYQSTVFLGQETVELKFDVVQVDKQRSSPEKLVLCHGLYGSKQNFRSLARQFSKQLGIDVYCVDLRNHGASPHSTTMTNLAMAADLLRFLKSISSNVSNGDISLLGHSMGGKAAMTLALHPDTPSNLLRNLIVEDISPIKGRLSKEFEGYARAMRRIMDMQCTDRKQADEVLQEIEPDVSVRQFLLTNVSASSTPGAPLTFRVPPEILADSIGELGDFPYTPDDDVKFTKPTLIIRGKNSNYVKDSALPIIGKFFPHYEMVTLNTGHWVHAEDPKGFSKAVTDFLQK